MGVAVDDSGVAVDVLDVAVGDSDVSVDIPNVAVAVSGVADFFLFLVAGFGALPMSAFWGNPPC